MDTGRAPLKLRVWMHECSAGRNAVLGDVGEASEMLSLACPAKRMTPEPSGMNTRSHLRFSVTPDVAARVIQIDPGAGHADSAFSKRRGFFQRNG